MIVVLLPKLMSIDLFGVAKSSTWSGISTAPLGVGCFFLGFWLVVEGCKDRPLFLILFLYMFPSVVLCFIFSNDSEVFLVFLFINFDDFLFFSDLSHVLFE